MRTIAAATLFVVLGCASTQASAQPAVPAPPSCEALQGKWKNQLGSTLNIQSISPSGAIQGTYISPSGTGGQAYPLVGWVNSLPPQAPQDNVKVLSFTVRWGEIGSITAWTGYCRLQGGAPQITAMWHLVRPNSAYVWDHILTNTDVFTPSR
ncbi:avidin/streptavidin family protein [Myxococcus fulvus]|uniref:avidin/streptavidin family protein n=1 Tax=Myxococcus fulvus TaxID=33 RepID=UPI003B9A2824